MMSSSKQEQPDGIADIVRSVRAKGVKLWSEKGQLRYRAPKGALTDFEIVQLRVHKDQILSMFGRVAYFETSQPNPIPRRPRFDNAPLSFSQLAHWNLYNLNEGWGLRSVASATFVLGQLDVNMLRRAISETVQRHDALRTRIVEIDGVHIQRIDRSGNSGLIVQDLTSVPKDRREIEVDAIVDQLMFEPIYLTTQPLFELRLLTFGSTEHVLIVVMEHMISDGFSINIVLRDVFTAYDDAANGLAISLPTVQVQFPDYAAWQRAYERSWIDQHGGYWDHRLHGCGRLRFPTDKVLESVSPLGWAVAPVRIDCQLRTELRQWSRARHTTLVMSVFTAYVALVLRWCDVSDAVILYQTDGRVSSEIENTVGYFASTLYFRVELLPEDTFTDLLRRLTEEYCNAYEHADSSYYEALLPRPDFTRNTCFNWQPSVAAASRLDSERTPHKLKCYRIPIRPKVLRNFERDTEPLTILFESEEGIGGGVYFPLSRFSVESMNRFSQNFVAFIADLVKRPKARVREVALL